MKHNKRLFLITAFLLSIGPVFCQMIILSGPEKGSYNRFANDIVTVLGEQSGVRLLNRPTSGSAHNFRQLTNPSSVDKIAFIQSDYLSLMRAEDRLNKTNKTGSLKVVMQLAPEEIHIVAKKSSGLKKLQDLENKKVAIGTEEQGSYATGKTIRERSKVNWVSVYVGDEQMLKDISAGRIDAGLIVGSAPMSLLDIDPQIMTDGISLLELEDFNGWARYYENDTIYTGDYGWLERNTPTFGVRTLLIANESKLTAADKQTIEAIKSGIIQNIDLLKKQGHSKWKEVIIPDGPEFTTGTVIPQTPNPDQASSDRKEAVTYRVQLYSRTYERTGDQIEINGKSYPTYVYSHLGAYRYTIGEFTTVSAAAELQNACREAGYYEAFVVAFKDNVRSLDPELFK